MMMAASQRMPSAIGVHVGARRATGSVTSDARLAGNLLRMFSSGGSTRSDDNGTYVTSTLHPTGLGLSRQILPEVMQTISALPEVSAVLPNGESLPPTLSLAKQISSLKRAEEIFQQFGDGASGRGGSNVHLDAVRMLLADRLCLVGKFEETATCIESILGMGNGREANGIDETSFELNLALAKAQFYSGGGITSAAERAVDTATEVEDADTAALRQGVALNALALSKLSCMDYANESSMPEELANEADECREMLSMATSVLNKPTTNGVSLNLAQSLALAQAASSSNQGLSEVLYSSLRAKAMGYEKVPPAEHALKYWKNALSQLEGNDNIPIADIIRSRLHSNIAMSLLGATIPGDKTKIGEEDLKIASENASQSLKLLDGVIERSSSVGDDTMREALRIVSGRSLHLVADCYARGESAVTAEGLYQSALDLLNDEKHNNHGGPLALIESREVYNSYALLCANWEKRSRDSDTMKEKAEQVEEQIAGCWRNKPLTYSGLWLFSVGDLQMSY